MQTPQWLLRNTVVFGVSRGLLLTTFFFIFFWIFLSDLKLKFLVISPENCGRWVLSFVLLTVFEEIWPRGIFQGHLASIPLFKISPHLWTLLHQSRSAYLCFLKIKILKIFPNYAVKGIRWDKVGPPCWIFNPHGASILEPTQLRLRPAERSPQKHQPRDREKSDEKILKIHPTKLVMVMSPWGSGCNS